MTRFFNKFLLIFAVLFITTCIGCSSSKHTTLSAGDKDFVPLFDGKTLNGWEGDPTYWRVENGIMTGEVTPSTILKRNSFILWRGGKPSDFELKIEYRVSSLGNSGVNYRSVEIDSLPYSLKGYQADIDGRSNYTGQNYEERGRQFLARRGQRVVIETGQKPVLTDSLGSKENLLKSIHVGDWNELHIVVRGNNMKHFINGVLTSEVTDNDAVNRTMSGLIGVQVHVGPPMKIEYKSIELKILK